ncbi:MAG: SHOCT domain-containing protein [Ruminococcaceae bacterium]|nr:SHOCT domain-containing protein [Oscillospiraceae bacterium]
MEEKVIIKSKQSQSKFAIILAILLVGVITWWIVLELTATIEKIQAHSLGYAFDEVLIFGSFSFLPFVIIAAIFYFWVFKTSLIVTDKRVYGSAAFGKRVDIPIDKISAVGTSILKGISVTSSSGGIKFLMIANNIEIHSEISKLLMSRQEKNSTAYANTSNADELKKYKDLLDSGVITKEEFDEKKKQLLDCKNKHMQGLSEFLHMFSPKKY